MDKKNWLVLFVIMILSTGLLITVMPVSAASTSAPTVKENPYEHWIEPSELKNCSIQCSFQGLYRSSDGMNANRSVDLDLNFDKGNWTSATHTFEAENNETVETGPSLLKETGSLLKKCKLVFDPGMNKIERFEFFSREEKIDCLNRNTKRIVNVTGVELLRSVIRRVERTDTMIIVHEVKDKTLFGSSGAKMKDSVKSIEDRVICTKKNKIGETVSLVESWCHDVDYYYYVFITFDGYLPKLPAYKGKCSWFGGKNDTGIDVTLRKKFYEEHVGEYTSAEFTYEEFYKNNTVREEFDKWMNERVAFFRTYEEAGWEGTALDCGPARNLDTENNYFCAMRWHNRTTERYGDRGKPGHQHWWRAQKIKVTNPATGKSIIVRPVDWGPNVTTRRVIDLSHRAMEEIGAETDTYVEMCLVDSNTHLGPVTKISKTTKN